MESISAGNQFAVKVGVCAADGEAKIETGLVNKAVNSMEALEETFSQWDKQKLIDYAISTTRAMAEEKEALEKMTKDLEQSEEPAKTGPGPEKIEQV